jgi:hypothetical protein
VDLLRERIDCRRQPAAHQGTQFLVAHYVLLDADGIVNIDKRDFNR